MTTQDSHLRTLLSPARSGTFFAAFRPRTSNPEGFDSKMKLWINAIEEWASTHKKLTLSVNDIHQKFVSDSGIRPDKECIRLVMSEMKRQSKLVPIETLKNLPTQILNDSHTDPISWLSWSVQKLVVTPATWAANAFAQTEDDKRYSDLIDMSINDDMRLACQKSLDSLSHKLHDELVRISKAEKQNCFEWDHLLELVMGSIETIIDERSTKELMDVLDLLIDYLALNKKISILDDEGTKLVKVIATDCINPQDTEITRKDVAYARLLKAKELLTATADDYHAQAEQAKKDALECYSKNEVAKAKSLVRTHKRLEASADQKEKQLTNVEDLLEQLEFTNSNMVIFKAYKDGAEALKMANTGLPETSEPL